MRTNLHKFTRVFAQKPFSLLSAIIAISIFCVALFELGSGNLYIEWLNYVDATTLVMVAILLLRAVTKLQSSSDLDTISIALVSSLSFLFSYEALYKWSFYLLPWRMPAAELRELLLQVGVGLILLTGFAQNVFKLKRINFVMLALYVLVWLFWLAVGFPQLWDGKTVYNAVIALPLTWNIIYVLNRSTKIIWFMFYFLLYD